MPNYYLEGQFAAKQGVKKAGEMGKIPPGSIEPYAKSIWANSPKEAIQIATAELDGGQWTDGPHVSLVSEEQRMRSLGAPELPGLLEPETKKRVP